MTDKTTTTTIPAMEPCPFCGDADPLVTDLPPHKHAIAALPDHPGSVTVECPSCDIGLIKPTRAEAIAAWNRRAAPSPAAAAPSVAQIDVGPNVAVQDVAEQVECRVNERGGEAAVDDIVALTIEVLWEMQRAAPAQPAQDSLTETAIDRAVRALMLHKFGDDATVMFDIPADAPEHARSAVAARLTEARREVLAVAGALSAARAAQPVGEVVEAAIASWRDMQSADTAKGRVIARGRHMVAMNVLAGLPNETVVDGDIGQEPVMRQMTDDEVRAALRSGEGR